jgi:DNA polymerase III epsilon subunit family exonuclease
MTSGVRLRPAEQVLVSRARDFLTAGPADAVDLIAHVCQLPRPPRFVADHMAMALLAAWEEFAHDGEGRWSLVTDGRSASWMGGAAADSSVGVGSLDPALRRPLAIRGQPRPHPTPLSGDRLADLSYVVVDVETTGGSSFGPDRITEIAAVVIERGEISRVFETLVNPQRPIPPMVTRLTRITWDMVKRKPTFREIVPQVADAIRGHVFVAHNAGFDWRFVTNEIARATGERLEGRRLCTVKMARKLVPQLGRRSLDHLARYYNVEISARHRAGGDAVATAKVFLRMLREAHDRGCITWTDLETLLREVPRGRRRGRRRSAMPRFVDRDTTA